MSNLATSIPSDYPDQTIIIMDGTRIEQFSDESILLSMDNVGNGFSFNVPFFPGTKAYRDLFRPSTFPDVQIYIGGNLVINGKAEKFIPTLTSTENKVNVQGRSKTGRVIDCSFVQSDFPIEFRSADLEEIADSVVSVFGIETSFPSGAGAIFEQAGPDSPTTKRFAFLQNLAKQRGLLMGETYQGVLTFDKVSSSGTPGAELVEGHQGLLLSQSEYDGTKRFSEYNAFGQEPGKNDNYVSVIDPSLSFFRPKSIQSNDTNQGNIEDAVNWALSADIASSINIPLGYEGWLRPDGELWAEGQFISLHAPSLMVYKPFIFRIKSVNFTSNAESKTTAFVLTLPEAWTGEVPEDFPWDE